MVATVPAGCAILLAALSAPCRAGEQEASPARAASHTVRFEHVVYNPGEKKIEAVEVLLALPRSEPGQEVLALDPPDGAEPVSDPFGNRLVRCKLGDLEPGHSRAVTWMATVRLDRKPPAPATQAKVSARFLADTSRYAINSAAVRAAVREALGDARVPRVRARRIFTWVRAHLRYRLAGGWDPAPKVLERGSGSCSEYSYVLIALLRAARIPARFAGGTVLRGQRELVVDGTFHRWVEAYLPDEGWIPLDATLPRDGGDGFGTRARRALLLYRGDGDENGGQLGWDYRSICRARGARGASYRMAYWSAALEQKEVESILATLGDLANDIGRSALLQREIRRLAGPMGSRPRLEWILFALNGAPPHARELLARFGLGVGYLPALRMEALECSALKWNHPRRRRLLAASGHGVDPGLDKAVEGGPAAVQGWWRKNAPRIRYNLYTQRFTVLSRAPGSR